MRLSPTVFKIVLVGTFFGLTAVPCVCVGEEIPVSRPGVPAFQADPLLAQGIDAERRGDDAAAERCYRQFLAQSPGNDRSQVLPLHRLAVLHAKQKQYDESEQFFQRAVRLDNDNLALLSDFAQLQFDRKRYRDAEIILKYGFLLEPDNTRILYNLGYSVALQPDRQTEGLRYLKLALGETKALRELAKIYRILGENDQAEFAEQRAAQQEIRLKAAGSTTEPPPNLEARKELYDQIKRELIRAKSLELAQELEKAGIKYVEKFDAEERKKDAEVAALRKIAPTEPLKSELQKTESAKTESAKTEPQKTESRKLESAKSELPNAKTAADAPFDPWGATALSTPYVQPVLKTPAASVSSEPKPQPDAEMSRTRPMPSVADQRSRISNGPGAIPLPPVDEKEIVQAKTLRALPSFADPTAPPHYPRYAEIGVKPSPRPVAASAQRPAIQNSGGFRQTDVSSQRKPGQIDGAAPPTSFDLVQPVNLVALEGRRERGAAAPTAPTPEKIDEIAVRSLPMVAPDPEDVAVRKTPSPENTVRRTPNAMSRNTAPTPDNVSPLALALAENTAKAKPAPPREEPAGPKLWKEIDVEPYVYVENVRPPQPSQPTPQTVPTEESTTLLTISDPWTTQRPASEPVAEFRGGNKLRENVQPEPTRAPEPPITVPTAESKPVIAESPVPEPESVPEKKEEPRQAVQMTSTPAPKTVDEAPRKEKEVVKLVPVPVPMPVPSEPTPKQEVVERPAPILEPPTPTPSFSEPKLAERRPIAPVPVEIPEPVVPKPRNERSEFVRPTPIVAAPEPPSPTPIFAEPKLAERRPIPPVPVTVPEPVAPKRQNELSEFDRPTPIVAAPEPPSPPRREEESAGVAQTPPSKVRIVNIVDVEPPPDDRPGFARSGNYGK